MQIIRRASFITTPWKNGGGLTHEAVRFPAVGEAFRWRLSVAQIDSSGPFSDFAGYDRKMVLLRGKGVNLTFDAAAPVRLANVGDMAEFDGALKTECRLIDGSCEDLNLMVSKSARGATATVERVSRPRLLQTSGRGIALVFPISGALFVECAAAAPAQLQPWDVAVMPAGGTVRPISDREPWPLVFFAALDDNSA